MQTLKELKKYLDDECCDKICIGKEYRKYTDNVFIVWEENERYFFAYCERGELLDTKDFDTEKEIVAYTLDTIENNKWIKAHLVAWTWSVKDILDAEHELERMHISFERNDDPYFDKEHGTAYKIFVFGKDVLRLSDFSKKYSKYLEPANETKKKLLSEIADFSQKLKGFRICINKKASSFFAVGYYFDEKSLVWKVFEIKERYEPYIYLETKNELKALNELYKIVLEKYKKENHTDCY